MATKATATTAAATVQPIKSSTPADQLRAKLTERFNKRLEDRIKRELAKQNAKGELEQATAALKLQILEQRAIRKAASERIKALRAQVKSLREQQRAELAAVTTK